VDSVGEQGELFFAAVKKDTRPLFLFINGQQMNFTDLF
jgi:hypothetical protein